ncbi:hypothetical protein Aduo_015058 [Ancylostoma duodenale]
MLSLLFAVALLATTGVLAQVRCPPEQDFGKPVVAADGNGLPADTDMKRTIDLNEMITNCTRLRERLGQNPVASAIVELLSRLQRIPPADVEMLADGHREQDNELVDDVLTANNIINKMIEASDEELMRHPPNLGALILASNDIEEYLRTHHRRMLDEDRQF